jgi:hypothetical protein
MARINPTRDPQCSRVCSGVEVTVDTHRLLVAGEPEKVLRWLKKAGE